MPATDVTKTLALIQQRLSLKTLLRVYPPLESGCYQQSTKLSGKLCLPKEGCNKKGFSK